MTTYYNPGGSGELPRFAPGTGMRDLFAPRRDLVSGVDSMFRPAVSGLVDVKIIVRGLNTVYNHNVAVQALLPGALGTIHSVTGDFATNEAKAALRGERQMKRAVLSGDTHDSTHWTLRTTPTMVKTSIGPKTFYAPLIEFGLARHMKYGPRPFMSIAFSTVLPHHLKALTQLAQIVSGPRKTLTTNPYAGPTNSWIQRFRAWLYDREKAIGDAIPLGIGDPGMLRPIRASAIGMARILGDVNAVLSKAVGARITRRISGQVTGRLIGIGANTVFTTRTFDTSFGIGQRIYNRQAGKYMARFVGQSNLLSGRFPSG